MRGRSRCAGARPGPRPPRRGPWPPPRPGTPPPGTRGRPGGVLGDALVAPVAVDVDGGAGDEHAGGWASLARVSASRVVPLTRVSRMAAFWASFQRRSPIPSPARFTTPPDPLQPGGVDGPRLGSQLMVSGPPRLRRTRLRTRWPAASSAGRSAEPMSPLEPVTATSMCLLWRWWPILPPPPAGGGRPAGFGTCRAAGILSRVDFCPPASWGACRYVPSSQSTFWGTVRPLDDRRGDRGVGSSRPRSGAAEQWAQGAPHPGCRPRRPPPRHRHREPSHRAHRPVRGHHGGGGDGPAGRQRRRWAGNRRPASGSPRHRRRRGWKHLRRRQPQPPHPQDRRGRRHHYGGRNRGGRFQRRRWARHHRPPQPSPQPDGGDRRRPDHRRH